MTKNAVSEPRPGSAGPSRRVEPRPDDREPETRGGVRRTLRYMSHLGWRAGWQAARLHGPPGRILPVRLRGCPQPLWARTGGTDAATFAEVFVTRQYELPFGDFAPRHILDLGANVGYAAVYFARRWPRAEILAVEPAAGNLDLLLKNAGPWPQITCLQAAVWSRATLVSVANPDAEPNAFRMTEAGNGTTTPVAAHTVAEFAACQGCERWDLVKMDVEGAEAAILRDASDWLDRVGVLVIELHDRLVPGCTEALCAALHGRRFRQEIIGSNLAIDFR